MSENYETATSAAGYEPLPAVVIADDGTQAHGTTGEYSNDGYHAPDGSNGSDASTSPDASTADVAKDQAAAVGSTAKDAGQHVASVAKDQASTVAAEAVQQGKDLLGQTRTELQDQAAAQQQRVATGIRSLSAELGSMADRSEQDGVATDLVRQAAQRAQQIAGWLDDRDPGALISEVKDFARRRPGTFLAIAAGAGLAAGRLTRGTVAANKDSGSPAPAPAAYAPVGSAVPAEVPVASPVAHYPVAEPWEGRP